MEWIEAPPGAPKIAPGEVHVWRFSLEAGAPGAADELSTEERNRANAMSAETARQSFVASQSALRRILGGYTGTPPHGLVFSRAVHGKPKLAATGSAMEFNVSHSGKWGLVAVADFPVGVDVEQVSAKRATAALEQRFLTDGERELLRLRAAEHGAAAFFMVWSRKEAYLKAAGLGLSAPFSQVDSSGARLRELDERGTPTGSETPWAIMEFFLDAQHPAALVARAAQISATFFSLRQPGK